MPFITQALCSDPNCNCRRIPSANRIVEIDGRKYHQRAAFCDLCHKIFAQTAPADTGGIFPETPVEVVQVGDPRHLELKEFLQPTINTYFGEIQLDRVGELKRGNPRKRRTSASFPRRVRQSA